jgi:methylmalonyl-CoA mutase cobalamin-binding domain/chain
MQRAIHLLEPVLAGSGQDLAKATVVLGTVENDIHELGKNLVGIMLRGAGFEVRDLGVDVPAEAFVTAAADGVDVVGISCLLSTTMANVPLVMEALDGAGIRNRIKVIVGGSPITQQFADQIGADGYAPNAAQAVHCVKNLLGIE